MATSVLSELSAPGQLVQLLMPKPAATRIPKGDLQSFLDDRRTKYDFLIVTMATIGQIEMLKNFRESLKRNLQNVNQYIVVCMDFDVYDNLRETNFTGAIMVKDILATETWSDDKDNRHEHKWSQGSYNKLMMLKIALVSIIISRYNQKIIYSDIDTAWVSPLVLDISDYTLCHPFSTDFVFVIDNPAGEFGRFNHICAGLIIARPTDWAKHFLSGVVQDQSDPDDQVRINEHYRKLSYRERHDHFAFLPWLQFINGAQISPKAGEGLYYQFNTNMWWVHANWRIGKAEKIALLKQVGVWYLD